MQNLNDTKAPGVLLQSIDNHFREYPARWMVTTQILLTSGTKVYQFPQDQYLERKPIHGMFVRMNTTDDETRNTITGNKLINEATAYNAFLSLAVSSNYMPLQVPLEWFIFQQAGTSALPANGTSNYRQLSIPTGITMQNCQLILNDDAVFDTGDAVEFTWFFFDPQLCEQMGTM